MAVTAKLYGLALQAFVEKKIDVINDTINVALVTSAYTPNQDTDQFWSTPQVDEVAGTGYTAGGQALGTKAATYTAATNVLAFTAANTSWANSTLTARYAVIYDATPGTAATDLLIAYVDFGADVSSTAAAFTITWDAAGIFTITAA